MNMTSLQLDNGHILPTYIVWGEKLASLSKAWDWLAGFSLLTLKVVLLATSFQTSVAAKEKKKPNLPTSLFSENT